VVDAYTRDIEHRVPIHPEHAESVLDQVAADDAVFTVETGMCNVWAARYITPNGRRRVIGSFLHGTMANALPHAIGAQFAYPNRQVISMSGDGGLGMLLGELLTVALHGLPVKIITFNNSTLGMVTLEMLVAGIPDFGVDHASVDYAAIAGTVRPRRRAQSPRRRAGRSRHRPECAVAPAATCAASRERQCSADASSSPTRLDDDVRATVHRPARLGVLGADGALLPIAHRAHAIRRDTERGEMVHRRPGALVAEREIVFVGATLVALPLDEDQHVMRPEPGGVRL